MIKRKNCTSARGKSITYKGAKINTTLKTFLTETMQMKTGDGERFFNIYNLKFPQQNTPVRKESKVKTISNESSQNLLSAEPHKKIC